MASVEFIKNAPIYSISVDASTLLQMEYIMERYPDEFTSFLYADREDKNFHIHTPFFPVQTNTAVHTEIDSEDLIQCMIDEGMDIGKINGHIHTHPKMDVKPSGTDKSEIVERGMGNFNAALIINEDLDIYGHLVLGDEGLYISDVEIFIIYPDEYSYNDYIISKASKVKSAEELREIANMDAFEVYKILFPLSDEEKAHLDNQIKNKFKKRYYTNYKKGKSVSTKPNTHRSNLTVAKSNTRYGGWNRWDDYEDYWEDTDSVLDQELRLKDSSYIKELESKSAMTMTDEEWDDYQVYVNSGADNRDVPF